MHNALYLRISTPYCLKARHYKVYCYEWYILMDRQIIKESECLIAWEQDKIRFYCYEWDMLMDCYEWDMLMDSYEWDMLMDRLNIQNLTIVMTHYVVFSKILKIDDI